MRQLKNALNFALAVCVVISVFCIVVVIELSLR